MDILLIGMSDTYMPLFACIVYLVNRKKIDKNEREIAFYCFFSFLLYGVSNVMMFKSINNLFLYHFFPLFELVLISHYLLKITLRRNYEKVWLGLSIAFFIFWILSILFFDPIDTFNNLTSGVESLIIVFLCLFYLFNLSMRDEILFFQKLPSFWIASGILAFAALSMMVFVSYFKSLDQQQGILFWTVIISSATFIKFTLISVGFLCYKRRPSSQAQLS